MSRKKNKPPLKRPVVDQSAAGWDRYIAPAALALILLTTFLVYRPALRGTQLWDDDLHITRPELQSAAGLHRIWFEFGATQQYYPVLHTAFWIEHKLWGNAVIGYHLVNLLWHMLSVVLVYLILKELKVSAALLAAAIFAVHPVMVESVAWISEQKNTLSTLFYFGALLSYLHFDESRRYAPYLGALALFALALLSKTAVVTLPVAILVIFWWQRRALSWRRDLWPLAPLFALSIAAGLVTIHLEHSVIGAKGSDFESSYLDRFLVAGRALWFYVGTLLWPVNVAYIYPRWTIDPSQWWQWLFPLAAITTTIALWSVRKRWRAPLAGWLYFCITLFPVLGFVNVYYFIFSFVADHLQYLASPGIIVLAAAAIEQALARLPQVSRAAGMAFCTLIVATLAVLTGRQTINFSSMMAHSQSILDRNPDCWVAQNNLGLALATSGNQKAAIDHFRTAIQLKSYHASFNNLGLVLMNIGQLSEALAAFQSALDRQPDSVAALNNSSLVLMRLGRSPEAVQSLERAIRLKPSASEAYCNLGNVLTRMGRLPEAIEQLQRALNLSPNDTTALNNMGIALGRAGRYPEAIEHLNRALQIKPAYGEAHDNLGNVLSRLGKIPEATEQFHLALELNRDDVIAHHNLASILAGSGKWKEALPHFEQTARLQPDSADAHSEYANALRMTGSLPAAIEQFQTALRLKPDHMGAYANLALAYRSANRPDDAIATAQKAIEVAQASGQDKLRQQIEDWLKHYQAELAHAAGPSLKTPDQKQNPTQSK